MWLYKCVTSSLYQSTQRETIMAYQKERRGDIWKNNRYSDSRYIARMSALLSSQGVTVD